jgi:hypothetical protein
MAVGMIMGALVTESIYLTMEINIVGNSNWMMMTTNSSHIQDGDTRSTKTTMNLTAIGIMVTKKEKESSKRHQLEELKEDFMIGMKSKKSLK